MTKLKKQAFFNSDKVKKPAFFNSDKVKKRFFYFSFHKHPHPGCCCKASICSMFSNIFLDKLSFKFVNSYFGKNFKKESYTAKLF